jgi:hypothetical protein
MTTQTAVLAAPTGLTLTAKLFTLAAPDTVVTGNTITVTERTNALGQYVASIVRATALPLGDYTMIYFSGARPVAIGYRTFVGTDGETATETAALAELDSDSRAAILAQQLIESYAADGAAPTVAQALMMLLQHHQQKSVSGTTVTIKKLDKSTTAATYTLDSATDPTSITRAT